MPDTWTTISSFEANTPSPSGGAMVVWIPRNSLLENVMLPPDPVFGDPEGGSSPVTFDFEGKEHTATVHDFRIVGRCYPSFEKGR